jgi:hypothetical protein
MVLHQAAKAGHCEVLQWAMASGCQWWFQITDEPDGAETDMCRVAAEGGHLEMLQWMAQNGAANSGGPGWPPGPLGLAIA